MEDNTDIVFIINNENKTKVFHRKLVKNLKFSFGCNFIINNGIGVTSARFENHDCCFFETFDFSMSKYSL